MPDALPDHLPEALPFGSPLVIANPGAGQGRAPVLPRLLAAFAQHGIVPEVQQSQRPGAAGSLARAALEAGRRYLVVVGGDGTVQEVLDGIVDLEAGTLRGDDPVLAVVPAGSGSDLPRTFGLDRSPEVLVRHLVTDDTIRVDVGRVRLTGQDGRPVVHAFLNVAQAGFGGTVVRRAAKLPRRLGAARYGMAIASCVPSFRLVETTVTFDADERTERLCNVVVANGQFFGGGMHVAPRALPSDGRFNLQAWGGTPGEVIAAAQQVRRGTHLSRDDVREWQSATVTVDAAEPLVVEADGEVLGTTPATFDLLPGLLRYKL